MKDANPAEARALRDESRRLFRVSLRTALGPLLVYVVAAGLIGLPLAVLDAPGRTFGIYVLVVGGVSLVAVAILLVRSLRTIRRSARRGR